MGSDDAYRDEDLERVFNAYKAADPSGERTARAIRRTLDMLYNGQHTGRYSPDQLFKTEKTHVGSVVEIELRRDFDDLISDGDKLDYTIADTEIDCKFSFRDGGWMLPPECLGELQLVVTADDFSATWSAGIVRASPDNVRISINRDAKTSLNTAGRAAIKWLVRNGELPENVLLRMDPRDREAVLEKRSGQQRVNELFRRVQLIPISRNTIATLGQQDDFMKRVRANGGARTTLQPEGFLIIGGDYEAHRSIALQLGAPNVGPGEFLSVRVVPSEPNRPDSVHLDGRWWRVALPGEPCTTPAPNLPDTRKRKAKSPRQRPQ